MAVVSLHHSFVLQSLPMKQLAPCCVRPWKTAPSQWMTAPLASIKTKKDVSSASASTVSSILLFVEPKQKKKFHGMTSRGVEKYKYPHAPAGNRRNLATTWFRLDMLIFITTYFLCSCHRNVLAISLIADHVFCFLTDCCAHDRMTSFNSFRWLLPWPGKILFSALPYGIWEGWFWLWGVRVQYPDAQVPTSDLHKDLPLRICVRTPFDTMVSHLPSLATLISLSCFPFALKAVCVYQ